MIIFGYDSFIVFFRLECWDSRTQAIREMDTLGKQSTNELVLGKALSDPLPAARTKFICSLTISKDPQSCPMLPFHDMEYFEMALHLTREPTCVMPIIVNKSSLQQIKEGYNLDTNSTDHVTYHYVVHCLLDCMMGKALGRRIDLRERLDKLGRVPTPYEYREVFLLLHRHGGNG